MFAGHYTHWRTTRMNAVDKYIADDFWTNKTLLELGGGYAENGHLFALKGCKVTSSDVRDEHIAVAKARYPDMNVIKFDCDRDTITDHYDVILHWGVLYHIDNVESHLRNVCEMSDYILLETEVCSGNESVAIKVHEEGYDQAYHSVGTRPSPAYIEEQLTKNGFNFKIIIDPILDSSFHKYSWNASECNGGAPKPLFGYRRYWICWKADNPSPLKTDV